MRRSSLLGLLLLAACEPTPSAGPDVPSSVADGAGETAIVPVEPAPPAPSASAGATPAAAPDPAQPHAMTPLPGLTVHLDWVTGACPAIQGSDADLDKRIEGGDACAAAVLAERLVARRGLPEDYQRAMTLFTAALDAGVPVSCWPFERSDDRTRYARCLERTQDPGVFALALAYGDGVPRDLDRAKKVANDLAAESCDGSALLEQIDKAAATPAGTRSPRYCATVACTTLAMNFCTVEHDAVDGFETSFARGRVVSQMTGAERQRYAEARKALDAYREIDASRVYFMHVGGTMRNLLASGRGSELDAELDDAVAKIIDRAPLEPADDAMLADLSAQITAMEAQAKKDGIPGIVPDPSFQADYTKALVGSGPAYARYERTLVELARERLGLDGQRALRAWLRRARIEGLKDEH